MTSPEDLDLITRTVLAEAGNQGDVGKAAVAAVIKNRLASGRHGQTGSDVVLEKNQFEPWNKPGGPNDPMRYREDDPRYQGAMRLVRDVFSGAIKDPTRGATHFYSPGGQAAMGRATPKWAIGQPGTKIGDHMFYNLGGAQPMSQPPAPGQTSFAPTKATPDLSQPQVLGQSQSAPSATPTTVGGQSDWATPPSGAVDFSQLMSGIQRSMQQRPQQSYTPPLGKLLFGDGGLPGMMNRTIGSGPFDGKGLVGGPLQSLFSGLGGGGAGAASAAAGPMNLAGAVGSGAGAAGAGAGLGSILSSILSLI